MKSGYVATDSLTKGELRLENNKDIKPEIIEIFKEILEVEELPENENFMELGGDSLMVQTLIIRIEDSFGVELTYQDIIENLTPADLAGLIIERASDNASHKRIEVKDREYYPMLPSQEHVFLLGQMRDTKNLYNIEKCYEIKEGDAPGIIDVDRLKNALDRMVDRYEILRTTFEYKDDKFVQVINKPFNCAVREASVKEEDLQQYLHDNSYEYNLGTLPLFHVDLIKTDKGNEYLSLSIHHIISDGTSMGIFFDALKRFYMGRSDDEKLLQFKDYAAFREDELNRGAFKQDKDYWLNKFDEGITEAKYSLAQKSGIGHNFDGYSVEYSLSDEIEDKLDLVAKNNKCSKFAVSFAAFAIFMRKFTKIDRVVAGVPSANRKHSELENSIGMYINTLPLAVEVEDNMPLSDLYAAVGKEYAESTEHGGYYSEEVLNDLKSVLGDNQLYTSVFIYQNFNMPKLRLGNFTLHEVYRPIKYAKTDITFEMFKSEGHMVLNIEYFTELFGKEDILFMAREYEKILATMVSGMCGTVKDVLCLNDKEKEVVINLGKGPVIKKEFVSWTDRFKECARKYRGRVALCDDNAEYTYEELLNKAVTIASRIKKYATPNSYVSIYMEHGTEQIVSMMAVLFAGCAYLPIDKMIPLERASFMLKDAACNVLITDRTCDKIPGFDGTAFFYDELADNCAKDCSDEEALISNAISCDDNAYMIYTSGSTGQPKGIRVLQKNLVAYVDAFLNEFKLGKEDVMMHQASIGFDASVEEIFPILTVGGTLAVIDKTRLMDSAYVKDFFVSKRVSIISVSPHLISEINKYWDADGIHTFISGGDVLKKEYIDKLIKRGNVYNTYGPTETTVCATYYCVREDDSVIPIGKPILNYGVHILDEEGNLCPIGVEGEICITGDGVTAGYIGRPDLTDKQFEACPFDKTLRMYRTRDTGILLPDGNIKYTGRCDKQLNIRGFRIETGEVESRLLKYEGVKFAVAVGKEVDGELCLCAYIQGERKYTVEELKQYLENDLPSYMIPQYFVNIDEVPLNTAGKVDEKKLINPKDSIVLDCEYIAPDTDDEGKLCEIWKGLLNLEKVGVNDNFFNIGGQSLKAIQLIGRINEEFGLAKNVEFVFEYRTIKEQAKHLADVSAGSICAIDRVSEKDSYETSYMQKDMYSVQALDSENTDYKIVKAFRVTGNLDLETVKNVIVSMVKKHEALRTSFAIEGSDVFQKISASLSEEKVIYVDSPAGRAEELLERVNKPFDMSKPGLFNVYIFKESAEVHTIVMVIHHIISDAVSIEILWRDFFAGLLGKETDAPEFTYKDFAEWQVKKADFEESRKYWSEGVSTYTNSINLPSDKESTENTVAGGATLHRELPLALTEKVNKFARDNHVTPYMLYLSAYALLLSKLSGQTRFLIGSPVVNRSIPELFNVVGVFINTVMQKVDLDRSESFSEFLDSVKANTIESLKYQDYPYFLLKEDVKKATGKDGGLFNVMFSLIEHEGDYSDASFPELGDFKVEELSIPMNTSMFELTLEIMCSNEKSFMNFEYRTDLFTEQTIEKFSDMFVTVLENAVGNPSVSLDSVDILSDADKQKLIDMAKGVKEDNAFDHVWNVIEKTMEEASDRPAVRSEDEVLTYKELSEMVNRIAGTIDALGCADNRPVAIYMDPSAMRIACILGIIKSGHTYLPLDKSWPEKRTGFALSDSNACAVLTDNIEEISCPEEITVIDALHIEESVQYSGKKEYNPEDTAYIIYTSGSSGIPKGVLVAHKNLASYVQAFLHEFPLGPQDVVLQQASIAFDSSIEEIYPALCTGGCIAVARKETIIDSNLFKDYLKKANVSVVSVSPFLLNELNSMWDGDCIHTFISGGDVLKKQYCNRLIKTGRVYNTYGPTESTVCATYYRVTGDEKQSIPIGRPIRNSSVYILDDSLNLVPAGAVGEICVAGNGVTKGYLNNDALTKEKFVINPYESGPVLYKTGDLGRLLNDGNIEYIGRKDSQINMRGYRIELGEIESRILDYEGVSDAVVAFVDEGDGYLCAYIKGDKEYAVEEMKKYLSAYLPAYMIPAYYVNMKEFPFNSAGKVDKSKLPAPFNLMVHESEYEEPVGDTETALAEIWSEILKISRIGRNDNFFDCGGQSLKAIILCNEVERRLGVKLPTSDVFKYPVLSDLAMRVSAGGHNDAVLTKADRTLTDFEASMQQKNIYILQSMAEGAVHYNMPAAFEVCGNIDIARIEQIINNIISENVIYRIGFEVVNDCIVQRIHNDVTFKIDYTEEYTEPYEFISASVKPFDLKKPPLIRCSVMRKSDKEYVFVLDIHHIISDGASIQHLVEDIFKRYNNMQIESPEYDYIDYSEWQKEYVSKEEYKKHKEYWSNVYDEIPEPLEFPVDYARKNERNYEGNSFEIVLSNEAKAGMERLAKEIHTTKFILYYTAFSLLINKYTNQDEFVIGIPTLGRSIKETDEMYGNFVNTLAIKNKIDGSLSLEENTGIIGNVLAESYDCQDVPFSEVIGSLNLVRDSSRNPLFDTMFSYLEEEDALTSEGISIKKIPLKYTTSKFDFGLDVLDESDAVRCILNYSTDLFKESTMKTFLDKYAFIIGELVKNPKLKVCDLDILFESEKKVLLEEYNDTAVSTDSFRPIIDMIYEQFDESADKTAVVCADTRITYRELDRKTNSFAHRLRELGIRKGDYVPVLMERSAEVVLSIVSIMRLGAVFVPLDVNWPDLRLSSVLEEIGAKCVVVNKDSMELGQRISNTAVCLDANAEFSDEEDIKEKVTLDDSIYVIYTSGSTGKPKGVEVYHRGITNRFMWMTRYFTKAACQSVIQTTNHMYDSAVWQFFWPLTNGGKTVIPDTSRLLFADYVMDTVEKEQITMIDFVPSVFKNIVRQLNEASEVATRLKSLRCVILGGEEIVPQAVDTFRSMIKGVRIFNLYGPTEASIGCICHEVTGEEGDTIPIGKPIDNVLIYILDKNKKLVPAGVTGEIYISGECVAKGYIGDSERTAKAFVDDPFSNKYEKMYKTGDLAKYDSNGEILFLGRADEQVKIRGFRIELGEIENAVRASEEVKDVKAIVSKLDNGESVICAYYIGAVSEDELRNRVSELLPYYMVPGFICRLEEFPISASGKLNKKALPKPKTEIKPEEIFVASNKTEDKLLAIYKKLLQLQEINSERNFFEQGGNSLLATLLLAKINKEFGVSLTVSNVFAESRIGKLAEKIAMSVKDKEIPVKRVETAPYYEASSAQKRMYVLNLLNPESVDYNMPMLFEIKGGKAVEDRIKEFVKGMVMRHESLRTRFETVDNVLMQRIDETEDFETATINSDKDIVTTAQKLVKPFDLCNDRLIRTYIINCENRMYFFIDTHHIISDGVSVRVMLKELKAYMENIELPTPDYRYVDYSGWQKEYMKSDKYGKDKEYWLEQFNKPVERIEFEGDTRGISEVLKKEISLSGDNKKKIDELIAKTQVTPFMFYLAVLCACVHHVASVDDITIGTPVSGRTRSEFEETVGLFVNTVVLRGFATDNMSFAALLKQIKNTVIGAMEHQNYNFDELVDELKIDRSSGRNPLFDIIYAYERADNESLTFGDCEVTPVEIDDASIKFGSDICVKDYGDSVTVSIEAKSDYICEDDLSYMAACMGKIIERIADDSLTELGEIIEGRDEALADTDMEELDFEFQF